MDVVEEENGWEWRKKEEIHGWCRKETDKERDLIVGNGAKYLPSLCKTATLLCEWHNIVATLRLSGAEFD